MNEVWKVGTLLVWLAAVAPMAEAAEHWVPMFPNADSERQGFLRIINHSKIAGFAIVDPCDDIGRCGRISLTIDADETVHFNSYDLEMGNEDKGLSGGVGSGTGDWRLLLQSTLNLEVLAYVRTQDGFLTAMHDVVEREEDGHYRVATFNPGRNEMQASMLRLLNPNRRTVEVAITGIDDKGLPSESVRVSLRGFSTRTITVQDLEAGGEGLEGALGEGAGKWQLIVEPSVEGVVDAMPSVFVMSLLQSPTGHLTNLSTAPSSRRGGTVAVPLFPAAGDSSGRQGFVRVINHSAQAGEVVVAAHDDTGRDHGSVSLELEPNETAHFNSDDLEFGNEAKGLSGGIGSGEGNWRMELSSTLDIEVLSYIRTSDGFLTSMHDVVPRGGSRYEVAVFNPASNSNQESRLRLTNPGEAEAEVTITGIDGLRGSPGTEIRVSVPAGASRTLTASELESGGMGFDGELGDGDGKWQLRLESTETILVMSLLDSPTGHLTNLSTAPGRLPYADEFPDSPLTHIHDDNALVMSASEDLTRNNPSSGFYSRAFYEWFTDDFDFLLLLSNLNSFNEGTSHLRRTSPPGHERYEWNRPRDILQQHLRLGRKTAGGHPLRLQPSSVVWALAPRIAAYLVQLHGRDRGARSLGFQQRPRPTRRLPEGRVDRSWQRSIQRGLVRDDCKRGKPPPFQPHRIVPSRLCRTECGPGPLGGRRRRVARRERSNRNDRRGAFRFHGQGCRRPFH